MKRSWLSRRAMMGIAALIAGAAPSIAGSGEVDLTRWTPPDIATVADDLAGAVVKHGYRLFTDTANEIGPTVRDPARRFACSPMSLPFKCKSFGLPAVDSRDHLRIRSSS
jgi:hypothetical protein